MSWLVIGAGVSGFGAAKYLRSKGETVLVSERDRLSPEKAQRFAAIGAELKDGGHDVAHLDGVTNVVVSPGLPPKHPLLVAAEKRGLPFISEIDLALRDYHGKVIAVTGTNGKSTTCAMLGHVLKALGLSVEVGGNFGDPPTAMLAEGRVPDWLVLELSSYQLEQSRRVAPVAAIFTSFSHDHMARHGSMAGYLRAKWSMFDGMPPNAVAVIPDYILAQGSAEGLTIPGKIVRVCKDAKELAAAGGPGFVVEGGGLLLADGGHVPLAPLGITERQNQLNAGFTLAALAHLLNRSVQDLAPKLAGFRGLPHRCELVGSIAGQPVINDSKSTNVESTLVALASQDRPVLLMMGGQGKGESYQPILAEKAKIAALVTFGASGPEIARDLKGNLTVHEFPTLKAALAAFGGILEAYPRCGVLFSPGCASFDEFRNYEERGDVFRKSLPQWCFAP